MADVHKTYLAEIRNIILELEHHNFLFTREEIVKKAKYKEIPEHEALEAINRLIDEHYIHEVTGTEGLLSRTVWRDLSPAFEEMLEY